MVHSFGSTRNTASAIIFAPSAFGCNSSPKCSSRNRSRCRPMGFRVPRRTPSAVDCGSPAWRGFPGRSRAGTWLVGVRHIEQDRLLALIHDHLRHPPQVADDSAAGGLRVGPRSQVVGPHAEHEVAGVGEQAEVVTDLLRPVVADFARDAAVGDPQPQRIAEFLEKVGVCAVGPGAAGRSCSSPSGCRQRRRYRRRCGRLEGGGVPFDQVEHVHGRSSADGRLL